MAQLDRFPLLQTAIETPSPDSAPQGELFARLLLRALPVMKTGPEDAWIATERVLH